MESNFPFCLSQVLRFEGGFSDNPKDPGGATMHGITLSTYKAFKNTPDLSTSALKAITDVDVAAIYRKQYWDPCNCGALRAGIDLAVFNFAVNAGVRRCGELLQSTLGMPVDGVIGVHTLSAANSQSDVVDKFLDATIDYYRKLPTFGTFGGGWVNRTEAVRSVAKNM